MPLRNRIIALALLLFSSLTVAPPALAAPGRAKNVIILMYDGAGATHTTAARWFNDNKPMALDEMYAGAVRTHSADSLITDSAPASTAYATGHKSNAKFIGVLPATVSIPGLSAIPADLRYKPVATVLEGARLQGKATGLIATSNVQHASPAGYSAHTPDRNDYNDIAEQQVYESVDVILGGGKKYLLPQSEGGTRTDGENLLSVLKNKGYEIVETRDQLLYSGSKKIYGAFAADDMLYEFDRRQLRNTTEPSLAEMTQKAINILSQDKDGFFLFVEGSKVDWASHANDPIGVISDLLAFDEAAKVALNFAKRDGRTLILAFADHGNGGMSIGSNATDKNYDTLSYEAVFSPLKRATLTGEGVELMLNGDLSEENIRQTVAQYYGITDLSAEELQSIQKTKPRKFNSVLGPMLSKRAGIGWTTTGHTGEDLFFFSYGPNRPVGLLHNTDIAKISAAALGFDLNEVDSKLFVEATAAFSPLGATTTIDKSVPGNIKLVVSNGNFTAEFPCSKNLLILNKKTYELNGLTVYAAKTDKVYIPVQAVDLVTHLLH